MLKITTLLLLFCTCIVIASAFNAKLTKSFFFVNFYNQLSYKLFHTSSGIIAYSVETWQSNNQPFPQYLLLDYKTGYANPILTDIMNECNHTGAVVFDRLHYHVQTSTLVYYCTANNSLLILDEEYYRVQDTIPIHLNETFAEAKLTGNGDFLYVLTMGTLYVTNQTSQLSKIDLTTREVKNTMKLNKGLAPGEVVNGFVIQVDPEYLYEQQAFILTNRINEDSQAVVNIYYFNAGDDTYELYGVTNFTFRSYVLPDFLPVTVLYSIGDYLVTNNDTDLIVFTTQGEVVYRVSGLYSKSVAWSTGPYIPALVSQEGSLDLYAMFGETVLKISVVDSIITAQEIANVSTMHLAYGNNNTNSLMLTTSSDQLNFTIADLETSELVYTSLADYGGGSTDQTLMLSNTTYGVFTRGSLYIFDLKTDQLLLNITRLYLWSFLYDSNIFYYIDDLNSDTCQLKQLDLTTLAIKTLYEYPEWEYCFGSLTQLKFSESGFPEHVISRGDNSFVIVTETFGAYLFTPPPEETLQDMIVYDFGTLSLHLLEVDYFGNSVSVHYYDYDNTTANFTEKDSYNISNTSVNTFYPIGDKKVVAVADGYFTMIDLQFGSIGNYTLPTRTFSVTGFYDNSYRKHLIFSDQRISEYWTGNVSRSMLFDANGLSPIPGSTNFTVQARAAGFCSYSVVDGFVSSVGLVKFYNACSDSEQLKEEEVRSMFE